MLCFDPPLSASLSIRCLFVVSFFFSPDFRNATVDKCFIIIDSTFVNDIVCQPLAVGVLFFSHSVTCFASFLCNSPRISEPNDAQCAMIIQYRLCIFRVWLRESETNQPYCMPNNVQCAQCKTSIVHNLTSFQRTLILIESVFLCHFS